MTPEDAALHELAGAIVNGAAVDWASAESVAADESLQRIIRDMRVIATIARLHESTPLAAPPPPWLARASEPPDAWGSLRVLEKIGEGAYGEVYRAWDPRLDREVALKLLPATADGEFLATSIIEEGRLLARVRHPNVVTIYGAERIDDRIGLWMEFIRERTLEVLLEEGRAFSAVETIDIGIQLCRAVSAVHVAGLLHRDIKTHNVMVTRDGRVVLMDFGAGRDWTNAERAFEQAIDLNPSLTETYTSYSISTLQPLGKLDEALRILQNALANDPLSLDVQREIGTALLNAGRYDEAIDTLQRVRATDPGLPFVSVHLGRALTFAGRPADAMLVLEGFDGQHLGRFKTPGTRRAPWLGHAYVATGRRADAESLIMEHKESPPSLAVIYAALGDHQRAFDALERVALAQPHKVPRLLALPEMAALRADARVQAMRDRFGLPAH